MRYPNMLLLMLPLKGMWGQISLIFLLFPSRTVSSMRQECAFVLQVLEREKQCYNRMRAENETYSGSTSGGCLTEWDGINCWNAASLGEIVTMSCPDSLQMFLKSEVLIQRNCTEHGWSPHSPSYFKACLFNSSYDTDEKKGHFHAVKILYTCGYAASLSALVTAIIIFSLFRKLHCPRNFIHMNLFVSFILRGVAVFVKDAVLFADENIDHCTMSTASCKSSMIFFHFSVLSNFSWLLVEGMYLHTLLTLTFTSQRRYFWWYIVIGWGVAGCVNRPASRPRVPALTITVWIKTRITFDDTGCWDDFENIYWWIIKTPILFAIFPNLLFFSSLSLEYITAEAVFRTCFRIQSGFHCGFAVLFPEWRGENHKDILPVQTEIQRHWSKRQSTLESNVFNLVTQDFTA
ncbi:vasoactive intestinal polypeptide receptor 1-like [Pelobates cultripes]|uniref:Vasoactive intestinal polypeptide receptor 1-like n=1 Tax=Pelobates cultripes TaxID=61616 RepID=A0AAD1WB63_PELCU|nr:vasoactive intestinal polypeptide receptor 1-like [Pelobates cultripes]